MPGSLFPASISLLAGATVTNIGATMDFNLCCIKLSDFLSAPMSKISDKRLVKSVRSNLCAVVEALDSAVDSQ